MSNISSRNAPAIEPRLPRAPITPVLRSRTLRFSRKSASPPAGTLLDRSQAVLTKGGRSAIALALDQVKISTGDEVLLPAYHCIAMRAPIEACGAVPVFYRLHQNLNIDSADLKARPDRAQPLRDDRALLRLSSRPCQRARAVRCPWFEVDRRLCPRLLWTYGIASGANRRFRSGQSDEILPGVDGGCLISFRHAFDRPTLSSRGLLFQLKTLVNILELYVNEQPSAYTLCASWRGWIGQLKTSFSQELRDAGSRVMPTSLERAFQTGGTEYDFLGDVAPHKTRWADAVRPHEDLWRFRSD